MTRDDHPSCLIIGAHGFVGAALVRAARARGYAVVEGTRASLPGLVGRSFDLVVNANGNARKYLARVDPARDYAANVTSVEASLREFPSRRYLLISSVDVYPTPSELATTGEDLAIDPAQLDTYGRHKLLAEQAVAATARSWLILRLAQMLGPDLRKGPIFDLIHGRPLWVDLASSYPFLAVDAAAEIALTLAASEHDGRFNLCGRGSVALREAVAWLGRDLADIDHAERRLERYAIATDKLAAVHPPPDSRTQLRNFLADYAR